MALGGSSTVRLRLVADTVRYFLAERNWPEYNTERYTGWPFQAFVNGTPKKGDVGFDVRHDDERYEADCIGHVIAVSPYNRSVQSS